MWSTKALQKSAKIKTLIISALVKIGHKPNFGEWQTSDKNFAFFGKHLQMRHPLFYLFLCRFLRAISNPFFFQTGRCPTRHLHKPTSFFLLLAESAFLSTYTHSCRKSTKHLRHCRCWLKLAPSSYIIPTSAREGVFRKHSLDTTLYFTSFGIYKTKGKVKHPAYKRVLSS